MTLVVGGFDEGALYGRIFQIEIPSHPGPVENHPDNPDGTTAFGLTWGGQSDLVNRLMQGYDPKLLDIATATLGLNAQQAQSLKGALVTLQMPLPIQVLALQDCINLALFFIKTTITGQNLTVGLRGVGGPIDVAVITRKEGLQFIQQKELVAK